MIKNGKTGTFILTEANSDGIPNNRSHLTVKLEDFEGKWIFHPDENVDLAIMPVMPLLREVQRIGKSIFLKQLDSSIIPTSSQLAELTAVEDILMVGYPIGLWDTINNYPIFRRGITATHPANNFNGKQEFLIDIACFPGSSGSPVVLFDSGNYVNKQGVTVIGSRFLFLGVLYAGPQYPVMGEIEIVEIPTKQDTLSTTNIPINLGVVIKSERLNDFKPLLESLIQGQ